jgi:hypothetical protein
MHFPNKLLKFLITYPYHHGAALLWFTRRLTLLPSTVSGFATSVYLMTRKILALVI